MAKANQQAQPQQLNVDVPPTVYTAGSNSAVINHEPEEFHFLFGNKVPSQQGAGAVRVHTIVNVTPQHAKRFLAALAENLRRYEQQFGEIKVEGLTMKLESGAKPAAPPADPNVH
jgi:uncharacterized protein DUF3467